MKWLKNESVDLVYGQPTWKAGRSINNDQNVIGGEDVNGFISVVKTLMPRYVVMTASKKAEAQIVKRLRRSFMRDNETWLYDWSIVRTNALLHGVPQDRDILFVIGFKNSNDKMAFHNAVLKMLPKPFLSKNDIPTVWPRIDDLADIVPVENGEISFPTNARKVLINNHTLPGRKESILSRLLWESVAILEEGQSFDDTEKRPAIMVEKGDGYFLKGQLPVRLNCDLPAMSIYGAERYIHPKLERPMTLRELARLFGVPDNFDLGRYYGPGIVSLGRFVPIPASSWIFSVVVESMKGDIVSEANKEFALGVYSVFTEQSRDMLSELKRSHGKWVEAYANRAFQERTATI